MVVIDVAMTETARHADYVLPAASQYEKAEATFFNFEFPDNTFQLRHPLIEPLPGTLPEAEIWARLVREPGRGRRATSSSRCEAAARESRQRLRRRRSPRPRRRTRRSRAWPRMSSTRRSGRRSRTGSQSAAALWGLAHRCAMTYPDAVRRAGHADGNELFDAILGSPVRRRAFTRDEYGDDFARIVHPDKRIALELPEMLAELRGHRRAGRWSTPTTGFPIVLSVGERRSFTANDIFRDPGWRKQDADGPLRISADDAAPARPGRRRARRNHHGARQRRGRWSRSATRCRPVTPRCRTASDSTTPAPDGETGRHRRRAELAHLVGLARRVRRHALAQARAGADRAG